MLLLLFILLLILSAVSLRRKEVILYSNVILLIAAQTVSLMITFPLRVIIDIFRSNLISFLFVPISLGLVSYLCIAIKTLCSRGELPSKRMTVVNFILSFTLTLSCINFDYKIVLYIVHPCLLQALLLLGWDFSNLDFSCVKLVYEMINGYTELFATNNNGQTGSTSSCPPSSSPSSSSSSSSPSSSSERWKQVHYGELKSLSKGIQEKLIEMQQNNVDFEVKHDKAKDEEEKGNMEGYRYFSSLAKVQRSRIRDDLTWVEYQIKLRFDLTARAQALYGNTSPSNQMSTESEEINESELLKISHGLVYNQEFDT